MAGWSTLSLSQETFMKKEVTEADAPPPTMLQIKPWAGVVAALVQMTWPVEKTSKTKCHQPYWKAWEGGDSEMNLASANHHYNLLLSRILW